MRARSSLRLCIVAVLLLPACHREAPTGPGDADGGGTEDGGDAGPLPGCGLVTCASAGASCGPVGDGCGGVIQCGSCAAPQTCGGGGTPSQCGGQTQSCAPRTCADYPSGTCGAQSDGCGGLTASCGGCQAPDFCGGGGPSRCGSGGSGGGPCTGLCLERVQCTSGTTSLSGTVVAPTNEAIFGPADPINRAIVYVPNGAAGAPRYGVEPFQPHVSCDRCDGAVSGSPLVLTRTGVDGKFKLDDVPVVPDLPLVIQVGKWRRMITIPTVTPCVDNVLSRAQTRLPRRHGEAGTTVDGVPVVYSDIPRIGFVTGNADPMECVLRKIGIDDADFGEPVAPIAAGAADGHRVDFYVDNGATYSASTPPAARLYGNLPCGSVADCPAVPGQACAAGACARPALGLYDLVVFACVGGEVAKTAAERQNVVDYADAGGRVFDTHYSYVWLWDQPASSAFSPTATWVGDQANPSPSPLSVWLDTSFAKGMELASWLQLATSIPATTTVANPLSAAGGTICVQSVAGYPSIGILQIDAELIEYTSTSTTAGGGGTCGNGQQRFRSVTRGYNGTTPAAHASGATVQLVNPFGQILVNDPRYNVSAVAGGTTSQQWAYRNTTLPSDQPKAAPGPGAYTPMHYTFNTPVGAAEQCGRVVFSDFHVYTGSGSGWGSCDSRPMNAQEKLLEFMLFDLTDCVSSDSCKPKSCADYGHACGQWPDGCGGVTPPCGSCPDGQTCGGGGTPGQCGGTSCTPQSCPAGKNCGLVADGCGGTVDCGTCTPPETCGGSGVANVCGGVGVL